MRKTGIKRIEHYSIKIISQVPVGFGLGSSAALSAGIAAALLSFLKIPWNKKLIFDIAYAGEKFFHGNPSGGDLAAVIEGGFLWFRREFEFLKTFSLLGIPCTNPSLTFTHVAQRYLGTILKDAFPPSFLMSLFILIISDSIKGGNWSLARLLLFMFESIPAPHARCWYFLG